MEGLCPVAGVLLFIGGGLAWAYYRQKSAQESWAAFASGRDLQFDNGGMFGDYHLQGEFRDVDVHCYTETRGSGKNQSTYTVWEAPLPDGVPFDLVVFDEHALSSVVEMFGVF